MTREEIKKFLDNTKVYVNGKSREIQEKLFSFGFVWAGDGSTEVQNTEKPFLFIHDDVDIAYSNDMNFFIEHENREINAKEILSLEVTEPSYRPFKTKDECWNEMQKHQPFRWLKKKKCNTFELIGEVFLAVEPKDVMITFSTNEWSSYSASSVFDDYTFADGTPFGILKN